MKSVRFKQLTQAIALVVSSVVLVNCSANHQQKDQAEVVHEQARLQAEMAEVRRQEQAKQQLARAQIQTMSLAMSPSVVPLPHAQPRHQDDFAQFDTNAVQQVSEQPVSTFSADVDTASYSFVRSRLEQGFLPDKDAVRLEEMLNYFDYQYPLPQSMDTPFKPTIVVHDSPWAQHRKLVHIGIQGYELIETEQPASNLVFLLDVSGSMNAPNKLPLVKQSIKLLLKTLKPTDTVAIVVYAGAAGTVLEPTQVEDSVKITEALDKLKAGGSTAGGAGLQLAYKLAEQNFDKEAVNRIILATDGDFNVGISDPRQLTDYVERQRESGIYLSVIGFGQGNYKDSMMQALAQNGNGIAAYIDTLTEAQKIFVEQATSSLFPIAEDLKIQVEFNPAVVREYRLLGYETRALEQEDFNNDKVDAGDIGSGHSVTAIYEITLQGEPGAFVDDLRYANSTAALPQANKDELGYLKLRYKRPGQATSELLETPILLNTDSSPELLQEVQFATAVAGFSQWLKDGQYIGELTLDEMFNLALENKGQDYYGYRAEFTQLIRQAKTAEEAEF